MGMGTHLHASHPHRGARQRMSETPKKRVLVCGGRDYKDTERLRHELDALHRTFGFEVLIEGGATGADARAAEWAKANDLVCETYPADWKAYGRAAGPLRNEQMLTHGRPDVVVAFPGGTGTKDMMRRTLAAGVDLVTIMNPPATVTP